MYIAISTLNSPRSLRKCRLHPLIHTLLEFVLSQDMPSGQAKSHDNKKPPATCTRSCWGSGHLRAKHKEGTEMISPQFVLYHCLGDRVKERSIAKTAD